jgi:hypothetical protein
MLLCKKTKTQQTYSITNISIIKKSTNQAHRATDYSKKEDKANHTCSTTLINVATQPYSSVLPPEAPTHDGLLLQAHPTSKATHASSKNMVKQKNT